MTNPQNSSHTREQDTNYAEEPTQEDKTAVSRQRHRKDQTSKHSGGTTGEGGGGSEGILGDILTGFLA